MLHGPEPDSGNRWPRNHRLCVNELTPAVVVRMAYSPADTASDEENKMLFNIAVVLVLGLGAALVAALLV
jgi:hypothetical protein